VLQVACRGTDYLKEQWQFMWSCFQNPSPHCRGSRYQNCWCTEVVSYLFLSLLFLYDSECKWSH
jgi:hypothetical protein